MKMRFVLSQISGVFPVAALTVLLVTGCGKRFEANSDGYAPVVPATSDPLTAEDQRRWEAAAENKLEVEPVLESDVEIESFLGDLTEQAPTYSEEELAEEAERIHKARKKGKHSKPSSGQTEPDVEPSAKRPTQPTGSSSTRGRRRGPSLPVRHSGNTSTTIPSAANNQNQGQRQGQPSPSGGNTSSAQTPTSAAPARENEQKPLTVAEREIRPARPLSTIGSDFCKSLNVTSANGNTDLSHLYNTQEVATTKIPSKELAAAPSVEKKNRFVCLLLPAAIRMNEEVYRMRIEVLRLQAKHKKWIQAEDKKELPELDSDEKNWLKTIAKEYGVSDSMNFEALLKRVEVVPLALLLSQAAVESGWGTSNATRDLNNIFGIHAVGSEPYKLGYDTNNAKMRVFPSVDAAISAYIRLLNTGTYYNNFRDARALMRSKRQSLDSVALMKTLTHYSERRQEYIDNVIKIMTESNKLTQFVFKEDEVGTSF